VLIAQSADMWYIVSMWLEAFVIAMCVSGYECNKTPEAYYAQNKEFREMVQRGEMQAKKVAGPFVSEVLVPYTMPLIIFSTGHNARAVINKYISIEGNNKEGRLMFGFTF